MSNRSSVEPKTTPAPASPAPGAAGERDSGVAAAPDAVTSSGPPYWQALAAMAAVTLLGAALGLAISHVRGPLLLGSAWGGILSIAAIVVSLGAFVRGTDADGWVGGVPAGLAVAPWALLAGLAGGLSWALPVSLVALALVALLGRTQMPVQLGRELAGYFFGPLAYVVLFVFVALCGVFFVMSVGTVTMRPTFLLVSSFLLPLTAPLLTMHLISQERANNSIELTLTAPLTEFEMVLSKWLAAVVVFAVALAPTLVFVWMLFAVSDRGPDLGQVWAGYFGLLLQGGAFLAVGVCASAFSRNQLAAALGGFVVCVLLTMVGLLEQINAVRDTEWSARLVEYLSLQAHLDTFFRGLVDLRDVVFLGSLTVFFLFLAVKGVELLKWR